MGIIIIMKSENSKTSMPHKLINLTDKMDLRRGEKSLAFSNLSAYYTWKNIKSSSRNNKFKISAPIWNDEFELRDGSYLRSDIQDYFEYICEKHGENNSNPPIRTYLYKIEEKIIFRIKTEYYLNKTWNNQITRKYWK